MSERSRADVDLLVIGDGPAGRALGAHAVSLGLKTLVVGPDLSWSATYGVWVDEIEGDPLLGPHLARITATQSERIRVWGQRPHELARRYAVLDNRGLVEVLSERAGGAHLAARVTGVVTRADHSVVTTSEGEISARLVCDASGVQGWQPGRGRVAAVPAWQTAYGVFLDALPVDAPIATDLPTLMDFRLTPGAVNDGVAVPTFCYVIPTSDGWLVEETVLAAPQPLDPLRLRGRLIDRLGSQGEEILRAAEAAGRVERVHIPMGGPLPRAGAGPAPFGAAAGLTHPATGYSVAASLRAAPRLARALATGADPWRALWPRPLRLTRRLHQYGAEVLLGMSAPQITEFFDAFFDLPAAQWQAYLRIDSDPKMVAAAMTRVFASSSPAARLRLMWANPLALRLR